MVLFYPFLHLGGDWQYRPSPLLDILVVSNSPLSPPSPPSNTIPMCKSSDYNISWVQCFLTFLSLKMFCSTDPLTPLHPPELPTGPSIQCHPHGRQVTIRCIMGTMFTDFPLSCRDVFLQSPPPPAPKGAIKRAGLARFAEILAYLLNTTKINFAITWQPGWKFPV